MPWTSVTNCSSAATCSGTSRRSTCPRSWSMLWAPRLPGPSQAHPVWQPGSMKRPWRALISGQTSMGPTTSRCEPTWHPAHMYLAGSLRRYALSGCIAIGMLLEWGVMLWGRLMYMQCTFFSRTTAECLIASPRHAQPDRALTAAIVVVQLRMSMRYLRDVLQMRFPQLRARAAAAEAEARAREVALHWAASGLLFCNAEWFTAALMMRHNSNLISLWSL